MSKALIVMVMMMITIILVIMVIIIMVMTQTAIIVLNDDLCRIVFRHRIVFCKGYKT